MDDRADVLRLLAQTKLFARVPREELAVLSARCRLRRLLRHQTIYSEDERADQVWLVLSGVIRIDRSCNDEEPVLLDVVGRGLFFGVLGGLPDERYASQASAVTEARVVGLPIAEFRRLVHRHTAVAAALVELLSRRLIECGRLRAMVRSPAQVRLARVLLWLRGKLGDELPVTRQLISEAALLTKETTIRYLSPMEKKGWIRTRDGDLRILAVRELERIAAPRLS